MKPLLSILFFCLLQPNAGAVEEDVYPRYKPSSGASEALDIRSNAYGASRDAPNALGIADVVPDFEIPKVGGGSVSLKNLRKKGPVAIIFYRGHW